MIYQCLTLVLIMILQPCGGVKLVGKLSIDATGSKSPKSVMVYKKYAFCTDSKIGIRIIDISNPASPTQATVLQKQGSGVPNTMLGWEERNMAFLFDDSAGVIAFDLTTPTQPTEIGRWKPTGSSYYAKNGVLDKQTNRLFVTAWVGGVIVVDVADFKAMRQTYYYSMNQWTARHVAIHYYGSRKYLWVGFSEGVLTFDIGHPTTCVHIKTMVINTAVEHIYVANDKIYASTTGQFEVWQPITNALTIDNVFTPYNAIAAAVFGKIAYVVGTTDKMYLADVSDPKNVKLLERVTDGYQPQGLFATDNYCYMVDGRSLYIYEILPETAAPPTVAPPTPIPPPTAVPTAVPDTAVPTTVPDTAVPTTVPNTLVPTLIPGTTAIPSTDAPPTLVPTLVPLMSQVPSTIAPTKSPIPITDSPPTPIPTMKAEAPAIDEEQISQLTGSAVAASAVLSGGSVGAIRLAVIAGPCRIDDKQPFLFHPLQFSVGGSQAVGAVVGNFTIILGFFVVCAIVLQLLTFLSLGNRSPYLAALFSETDAQGLLRLPSAPLVVFQILYQGTSLAGMQLIESGEANVWRQVLGCSTVFVCFAVPLLLLRIVGRAIPTKAVYFLSRSNEEVTRHALIKSIIGPGEWVSVDRGNLWANRYSSLLRAYRPECVFFSFVDYASSLALAAIQRIPVENNIQCGHVKLFSGFIFIIILIIECIYWPHARSRDSLIDFVFLALQAFALLTIAVGFYASYVYTAATVLSSKLLLCAGALLMLKVLIDLFTEIYVIAIRRRNSHQREYWGKESDYVMCDQFHVADCEEIRENTNSHISEVDSLSVVTVEDKHQIDLISLQEEVQRNSSEGISLMAIHNATKENIRTNNLTSKVSQSRLVRVNSTTASLRTTNSDRLRPGGGMDVTVTVPRKASLPDSTIDSSPLLLPSKKASIMQSMRI